MFSNSPCFKVNLLRCFNYVSRQFSSLFNKDRRPTKVLSDNFFSNYGIRSANENKKLFPKVGVM